MGSCWHSCDYVVKYALQGKMISYLAISHPVCFSLTLPPCFQMNTAHLPHALGMLINRGAVSMDFAIAAVMKVTQVATF